MTVNDSTPKFHSLPEQNVNEALNKSRWFYFKSLQEDILAACFDSAVLADNPNFIEIDEFEYRHLLKGMQS